MKPRNLPPVPPPVNAPAAARAPPLPLGRSRTDGTVSFGPVTAATVVVLQQLRSPTSGQQRDRDDDHRDEDRDLNRGHRPHCISAIGTPSCVIYTGLFVCKYIQTAESRGPRGGLWSRKDPKVRAARSDAGPSPLAKFLCATSRTHAPIALNKRCSRTTCLSKAVEVMGLGLLGTPSPALVRAGGSHVRKQLRG